MKTKPYQCPGCGLIAFDQTIPDANFNHICICCGETVQPLDLDKPSGMPEVVRRDLVDIQQQIEAGDIVPATGKDLLRALLDQGDCPQMIREWIDNLPPERINEVITQVFQAAARV